MDKIILGDVHGDIGLCRRLANANVDKTIIQIGDLGVGTPASNGGNFDESSLVGTSFIPPKIIENLPANFKFFVGNHDCRAEAIKLKNCLGHYGEFENVFFVSGAHSFDGHSRLEGVSYWRDEELNHTQANDCIDKWEQSKSKILLSHDAPQSFVEGYYLIYGKTFTRQLLQRMIEVRKPDLCVTGHHHKGLFVDVNGIKWKSLGLAEEYLIK